MEEKQEPGLLTGALVGGLLTAPLIAIFYLADKLAGLPFIPFDIFDWVGRNTPGDIITAVIDVMVDTIISLNLGEISSTAKTIEQIMGLVMTLAVGIIVAALFFLLLNRSKMTMNAALSGVVLGIIGGVVLNLISENVNLTATADITLRRLWVMAAFTAWGAALGWIYTELLRTRTSTATDASTARAQQINRRQFLVQIGGATATLTVVGAGLSLLLDDDGGTTSSTVAASLGTGNLGPAVSGDGLEPAPGTRPEYTPLEDHYRIDISARPPVLDEESWRLYISGLVQEPVEMTLGQLVSDYTPMDQIVTLSCISNRIAGSLISTTRWTGVPLHTLLDDWNLLPEATHLRITSADGFDEYVALETIRQDERVMLCYAWDGQPLLNRHGFPLRIYIPDHYGMKQPKWITDIEAVESWGEGYWVRRGWSATALVNTTSVIDTVATDSLIQDGDRLLVPVGGIAYSGAKQIARVEVQVNDGEWTEAQLRTPLSETSWVIWRYDWPFSEGSHTFRVRCYDGASVLQEVREQGVRPDGATGIHSLRRNL